MKTSKIKFLIFFVGVLSVLTGCQQDFVDSKATFWPVIVMNGDAYMVLEDGAPYVEPGATVTVNGAAIPYETVSDVDDTQLGVYTVVYSAANEDGISAEATRTVVVVDSDAALDDLAGSYQRNTNTPVSVWAQDPDRPYGYFLNNPGGVNNNPPFNVTAEAYNVAPGIVVLPLQQVGGLAPFYATATNGGSTLVPFNTAANVGDVVYSWWMVGPNFSVAARTFKKL